MTERDNPRISPTPPHSSSHILYAPYILLILYILSRKYAVFPFYLDPFGAEVDQQTDIASGGDQVVDDLGLVDLSQLADRFQFDHDPVLDHQVRLEDADRLAFVEDRQLLMGLGVDAVAGKLHDQAPLVNRLEEPEPERIMDLKGTPDNHLGQRLVLHRSPLSFFLDFAHRADGAGGLSGGITKRCPEPSGEIDDLLLRNYDGAGCKIGVRRNLN